jgi:hypothetical protein
MMYKPWLIMVRINGKQLVHITGLGSFKNLKGQGIYVKGQLKQMIKQYAARVPLQPCILQI